MMNLTLLTRGDFFILLDKRQTSNQLHEQLIYVDVEQLFNDECYLVFC